MKTTLFSIAFAALCTVIGAPTSSCAQQEKPAVQYLDIQQAQQAPTEVMQGHILVLQNAQQIQRVEFMDETFLQGQQISNNNFVLPVGLRAKLGTYPLKAYRGDSDTKGIGFTIKIVSPNWPEQHITLKDTTHTNISDENLKRIRAETARIYKTFDLRSQISDAGLRFIHPLEGNPKGNRFGARRVINEQPKRRHTGRDYSAAKGTKVRASERGTVVLAEEHFFAGNSVFIDHGDGFVSMYFHLDTIAVKQGTTVEKAQTIGTVGATGRATGPHLHYGFRYRNKIIDPDALLVLSGVELQ